MPDIVLHDTATGRLQPLPVSPGGPVGIYACGPTVYSRIHVGNARPFVVFSLLRRFLAHLGYEPKLVINVTDVNDKIYEAARERGVPSARLAAEMTAAYREDTDGLGLGRPDAEPLATATIGPIVALIEDLIEAGHAYAAGGDVYFSVSSWAAYGALSHRAPEDMDQGEKAEVRGLKRAAADFALWKASEAEHDTGWESPWGRGRPGWHIECSAMAEEALGPEVTIHGGGSDLVFPHHENEAAQTQAARGRPLARIWMHNGMLRMADEKMSKSLGNVFGLREALAAHGRDALVMFFCEGHYRQPVRYSAERLAESARSGQRIREAARRLRPGAGPEDLRGRRDAFFAALADDFNTPRALAEVFGYVREVNRREESGDSDLREMLGVLALENLLDSPPPTAGVDPEAHALLEQRERARADRDFAEADRLRDAIVALGWQVRDSPAGPELVPL